MRRALCIFILWGLALPLKAQWTEPESVVVVASRGNSESVRLARYYMEKRRIPEENLVLLKVPSAETIRWDEYIRFMHNPLLEELVERGWIDAVSSELLDDEGRRRYAIAGHKIGYLVLCRGIPLRISNDSGRIPEETRLPRQFKTNRGSVDSELSLLVEPEYRINSYVQNPLYMKKNPALYELEKVIKVARLDGPALSAAKGLADGAIFAEEHGLMGRAYVDIGGAHPRGDRWLQTLAAALAPTGFDIQSETTKSLFAETDRFDAPALYFGWYAGNIKGPFLNPGFRFPPGAIAMHIQSFSAATLRSARTNWCGPFVALGATATMGNVWEPFLDLTHRPEALFTALQDGMTLGEAAYYALPVLSWQAVLVGDPLYRPFKVPLDEQLARLDEDTAFYGQYAYIRKMNLLRAEGKYAEAIDTGKEGFRNSPGMALGLELARSLLNWGDKREALQTLGFAQYVMYFTSDDWLPAKEVADLLAANGDVNIALVVYRNLIQSSGIPDALMQRLLRDGEAVARQAGDIRLASEWKSRQQQVSIDDGS